ncbi:hypothetical protein D3C86_1913140 [compost metagenome]
MASGEVSALASSAIRALKFASEPNSSIRIFDCSNADAPASSAAMAPSIPSGDDFGESRADRPGTLNWKRQHRHLNLQVNV